MAAKNDLIAIYRLEFYKKKKNWKLCQNVCKKEPETGKEVENESETIESTISNPIKQELNKTYNVDRSPEGDQASVLNEAFIDADFDNIPPEIPTQPDPDKTDLKDENPGWVDCIEKHQEWEQNIIWDKPESPWEWPASGTNHYQHVIKSQEDNLECHQEDYTASGWHSTDQHMTNETWLKYIDEGGCCPDTSRTNPWTMSNHTASIYNTDIHSRSSSLESLSSFMLGAACASHSSEVDVTAMTDEEVRGLTYCLSLQPEESLLRHTDTLRHLLAKATIREQNTHKQHPCLYQEAPTRDPGPAVSSESSFVSGSFDSPLDLPGKGRGRLRARPGVIAIRMGRPYRIQ